MVSVIINDKQTRDVDVFAVGPEQKPSTRLLRRPSNTTIAIPNIDRYLGSEISQTPKTPQSIPNIECVFGISWDGVGGPQEMRALESKYGSVRCIEDWNKRKISMLVSLGC